MIIGNNPKQQPKTKEIKTVCPNDLAFMGFVKGKFSRDKGNPVTLQTIFDWIRSPKDTQAPFEPYMGVYDRIREARERDDSAELLELKSAPILLASNMGQHTGQRSGPCVIDIDIDAPDTDADQMDEAISAFESCPFIIAHWQSLRGNGHHALFVTTWERSNEAIEHIKVFWPTCDKQHLGPQFPIMPLPGQLNPFANVFEEGEPNQEVTPPPSPSPSVSTDAQKRAYWEKTKANLYNGGHLTHYPMTQEAFKAGGILRECGFANDEREIEDAAKGIFGRCNQKGGSRETLKGVVDQIKKGIELSQHRIQWEAPRGKTPPPSPSPSQSPRMTRPNRAEASTVPDDQDKETKKKQKKPCKGDLLRRLLNGWKWDKFKGEFVTPSGQPMKVDDACAQIGRSREILEAELSVTMQSVNDAMNMHVRYNPPCVIDSLTDRANTLAAQFTQNDENAITRTCSLWGFDHYETRRFALWLYQVMARAFIPGEKCDGMILLSGPQATRKTTLFHAISRQLIGTDAFDFRPNERKDRDQNIRFSRHCVALIDEFDQYSRKADVAAIKEELTKAHAHERAAWARDEADYPYRAAFAGTTNITDPLPPGENEARRFWVIRVKKPLEFDSNTIQSMLRQAAHDVQGGLEWREQNGIDDFCQYGKIWVQTADEQTETAERNRCAKGDDDATICLAVMCAALNGYDDGQHTIVKSAKEWASAAETGTIILQNMQTLTWTPTRSSAAKIRTRITDRIKTRRNEKGIGRGVIRKKGYSLTDLIAEFGEKTEPDGAQNWTDD